MLMGEEQQRRLMEMLSTLAARDAGEIAPPSLTELMLNPVAFDDQEHADAVTLTYLGWIRPRSGHVDVLNTRFSEGIFAFDLTDDGRAVLEDWLSEDDKERHERPLVMMIHGSQKGRVPQVVDDIRLWCFEQGIDAFKAADLPNAGRFVNDKVNSSIEEADYYVVVLTADEELTTGEFRPRPNAMIEMGRVLAQDPALVCVLKEDGVEMPSD